MAITDIANHALLIDGEDVEAFVGDPTDRASGAPGAFSAPTVVTGAPRSSEIVRHGAPAPADETRHGLAASAWTRDVLRARRAARGLEAGTVWINEHLAIGSEMPHGVVKGSGFGKDMSR